MGLALWAFRSTGLTGVAAAAQRIGWSGGLIYCLYSLGLFVVLGAAWLASTPDEPWRRTLVFAWARLIREAVADLLPFSQIAPLRAIGRSRRAWSSRRAC